MEFALGGGTVKIIPATALRDVYQYDGAHFPQEVHGVGHPINAAYYMGGVYNPAYMHEPYGHNAYIDASYGDATAQQYPFYSYNYAPYNYTPAYPGAYGPYPGASGAYRPYPQPQPSPPRRSRTAPSRPRSTAPTTTGGVSNVGAESRRSRGFSAEAFDRRQYKAYSGPVKKPIPMYRKRREPSRYQETDFGGGGDYVGGATFAPYNRHYYNEQVTTLRRMRPFYAPSYTTYPPSTMHRKAKMNTKKYPLYARMALKAAQLILGAAVIGLVLGPMKGNFHDFVINTKTEWQGLVLGVAVTFSIFSGILLVTSYLANDVHMWRKVDALITAAGCFCWLLCGFVEAYFAACYPPNGPRINLVCHRVEWILADIFCFINMILFVVDFVFSWMAGVTIL